MDQPDSLTNDTEIRKRLKLNLVHTKTFKKFLTDHLNDEQNEVEFSTNEEITTKNDLNLSTLSSSSGESNSIEGPKLIQDVIWNDLAEQIRLNLLLQIDDQIKSGLNNLILSATSKENHFHYSQWNNDWMSDKQVLPNTIILKNLPVKQYRNRDSVLTTLFKISHIRTVYNIFVAVMIIFVANTVIQDLADPPKMSSVYSLDALHFAFGRISDAFKIWLTMIISSIFVPFWGLLFWHTHRSPSHNKPSLFDWICLAFYGLYQICFFVLSLHYVVKFDLPPISSMIVAAEKIRLLMKSHAFVRSSVGFIVKESIEIRLNESPCTNGGSQTMFSSASSSSPPFTILDKQEKKQSLYKINKQINSEEQVSSSFYSPDFSKYLYFLFAPTLIYRESYPRTTNIRWNFVVTNLIQVCGCFIFSYFIFMRFCVSQFALFGRSSEYTFSRFIITSTACTLPGGLLMLLAFYAFLHSWFNAFAEMLRFGDRLFYKDWWNATAFSTWYRSWNVVVHDWLHTYVYRDIQLLFVNNSKALAATVVFWLSAAVHEYIIMLCLRFCLPVLFLFFAIGGWFLFFVQGTGRGWNVMIWISLFTGWGQMMCLYSMEWYARQNCPPVLNNWLNFFVPHILFCQGTTN